MRNKLKSNLTDIFSIAIVVCMIAVVIFALAMTPGCRSIHKSNVKNNVGQSVVPTPQDSLIERVYRPWNVGHNFNTEELEIKRDNIWVVPKGKEIPYKKLEEVLRDWIGNYSTHVWLYTSPGMSFNFYCTNHIVFPISPEGLTLDIQSLSPDFLMYPERIYCFTGTEGVVYRPEDFAEIGWETIDSTKFQFRFPPNRGAERYWEVSMYFNENSMYDGIRRYQEFIGGRIDENPWEIATLKFLQPALSDSITNNTFDNDRCVKRYPRKISRPPKPNT